MSTYSNHCIPRLDGYSDTPVEDGYALLNYVAAGDVLSEAIPLDEWTGYSIAVSFPDTGSPVGTVSIEESNDVNDANGWCEVASASTSEDSPLSFDRPRATIGWVRARYTRTSGTITISINVNQKVNR